jgi:NAD(P)-dependent dehydrogenase (short-subunit alcohol dehydrogenase family)
MVATIAGARKLLTILNVNLMSYAFCAKAAVPLMRRGKGGAIVASPPYVPSSQAAATCSTTPPRRRSRA